MNLTKRRKLATAGSAAIAMTLCLSACNSQMPTGFLQPKMSTLIAMVTVTGGMAVSGSYQVHVVQPTCADVAQNGTHPFGGRGGTAFDVPSPSPKTGGAYGATDNGHIFVAYVGAQSYHGPGTYTGAALTATSIVVDPPPDDQETHNFAFPKDVGTLVVHPDGSGSYQFSGLKDAASTTISGQVIWTCINPK